MTDTSGNPIQAHGGDILQQDGYFYWFGEDKTGETTSGHFVGVNCYRSADFQSWEHRGAVLTPQENTNISSASVVERPKVLYNDKNDEYVMWFHSDSSNYGAAMVGVATSKTVDGDYIWKGSFKPFGTDSRDMTVWKDTDGAAYLIFASDGNADLKLASLDADYYNVDTMLYTWTQVFWEAPGVFKIDGTYYLLYSRQDGWTPTDNFYMSAASLSGPWSDPVLLSPANTYAYNTQNAYDITITGSKGTVYLYYGDHWNAPNLGASTYSFYPVIYNGSGLSLHRTQGWSLDVSAGTWADLPYTTVPTDDFTDSAVSSCTSCSSGKTATLNSTSSISFAWTRSAGAKVLSLKYAYSGGKQAWKTVEVFVDGVSQGAALLESTRSEDAYFDAPIQVSLAENSTVKLVLLDPTTVPAFVTSVDVFDRDV